MINEENKINSKIDLKRVKFCDIHIDIKKIIDRICLLSVLNHFLLRIIPFMQIYYLSIDRKDEKVSENNEIGIVYDKIYEENKLKVKIFTFLIGWIGLKFLFLPTEYINDAVSMKYFNYFKRKKYYEIGVLFRNSCVICLVINVIYYFPFIHIANIFLNNIFTLTSDNEKNLSQLQMLILSRKIIGCLNMNFFALIFYSINKPLQNMILCFESKKKILLNNFLRFILTVTLCKYFSKKDPEFYFLIGVGSASVISEIVCLIFLIITQSLTNPYPQTWIKINLSVIRESRYLDFIKINFLNSKKILVFLFMNYFKELILIVYLLISANLTKRVNLWKLEFIDDITICIFSFLCVSVFFNNFIITKVNTILSLNKHTKTFSLKNPLETNFYKEGSKKLLGLFTTQRDEVFNNNLDIMVLIKTIVFYCLFLNLTFVIVFSLLNFLDCFSFLGVSMNFSISFIVIFSGLFYSTSGEFFTLNKKLENKHYFYQVVIAHICSAIIFLIVSFIIQVNCYIFIILCHLGYFYLCYVFWNFLRHLDIRIVVFEKILKKTHNEYLK